MNPLSEIDRLKAENHLLRVEVARLQAQLADAAAKLNSVTLSAERERLVEEFRSRLRPPAGAIFDFETLTFRSPGAQPRESR